MIFQKQQKFQEVNYIDNLWLLTKNLTFLHVNFQRKLNGFPNCMKVLGMWVSWTICEICTYVSKRYAQLILTFTWKDLFPGAMVEYPVKGGLLSPTFSCILGQTFLNLRRGDRFWYENPGQFSPVQLQNIRNISLSRVICDTSDGIRTMQPIVFLVPDDIKNPRVDCSNYSVIPIMDFNAWKEEPLSFNLNSISRFVLKENYLYLK